MTIIRTQDPKYSVDIFFTTDPDNKDKMKQTARIVNTETEEAIPEDEPIVMFRAQDEHALRGLYRYAEYNPSIQPIIEAFEKFRENQPHRMKIPT
jgi:hypothetical protein